MEPNGIVPIIDRRDPATINGAVAQFWIPFDYWADQRWNSFTHFILSWADQHIYDQRYNFYDDDKIQDIYPEVATPWKFPDLIYVSNYVTQDSTKLGVMLELPYFDDTGPISGISPSSVYRNTYVCNDPSLPEYKMRFVSYSGAPTKAVLWGPAHNIPANRKMLIAPFDWLGYAGPTLGETWETQPPLSVSGKRLYYRDEFPNDPTMPHGDHEPLWNDGLDAERQLNNRHNRMKYAHKRGTSDRLISMWGQYTRPAELQGFDWNAEDGVFYNTSEFNTELRKQLFGEYEYKNLTKEQYVYADPAHFNELNTQNFHRTMTNCLLCYNKDKCKAANALSKFYDGTTESANGRTGSLGFMRNHFVDVPTNLNPSTAIGQVYANTHCMYSTGSIFEFGFNVEKPTTQDNLPELNQFQLSQVFKRYNFVSDFCQVNGQAKRVVEYTGHYELLKSEVARIIMRDMQQDISNAILTKSQVVYFPVQSTMIPCTITKIGTAYDNQPLYRLDANLPFNSEIAQYGFEYGTNNDLVNGKATLAYFTVFYESMNANFEIRKVWAFIWRVSEHKEKASRVKIRRLVEVVPDQAKFFGNGVEVQSFEDFSGGSAILNTIPFVDPSGNNKGPVKRGCYQQINGQWIWNEEGYDLSGIANQYLNPSGRQSQGRIEIKGLPGEIVPYDFVVYAPPKLIKWGKSKTDPNAQKNVGKTRYWYDARTSGYARETGDIDDLFYHLSYQDASGYENYGALTEYKYPQPIASGYYSEYYPASGMRSPYPSSINNAVKRVIIENPYARHLSPSGLYSTEFNTIDDGDIVLKSDLQHARNFTAPIFAYEITTDLPRQEVVKPEYYVPRMDWCRREFEPIKVAAQRQYSPVPGVMTFAQNSENREVSYTLNLGYGFVDNAEGIYPIKKVWHPQGKVWWNRKGLLGCMIEQRPGKALFTQKGVAIANFWRKQIPHHMEVVKAYLFLEPTLEHNISEIQVGDRTIAGFSPFEGIGLQYDYSARKSACNEATYWAGYASRVHKGNQFLGGRIVGFDVNAQMDSPDIWEKVLEFSPLVVGNWRFPVNAPLEWSIGQGVYSVYDIYHAYDRASVQSDMFLMKDISVKINGQPLTSNNKNNPNTFHQRSPDWYDALAVLFEDGGFTFKSSDTTTYYRNANRFRGVNRSKDAGEGTDGKPDPLGLGYGYSRRGGGWKSPYIFDITPFVRKAHEDRFDAQFTTVAPVTEKKRSWEENN